MKVNFANKKKRNILVDYIILLFIIIICLIGLGLHYFNLYNDFFDSAFFQNTIMVLNLED